MARPLRKTMTGKGAYHHLYNRVNGPIGDLPFTDVDKEKGFLLLEDIAKHFLVKVISIGFMTNHFHLVCFAPGELPSPQEAADQHNATTAQRNLNTIRKRYA